MFKLNECKIVSGNATQWAMITVDLSTKINSLCRFPLAHVLTFLVQTFLKLETNNIMEKSYFSTKLTVAC